MKNFRFHVACLSIRHHDKEDIRSKSFLGYRERNSMQKIWRIQVMSHQSFNDKIFFGFMVYCANEEALKLSINKLLNEGFNFFMIKQCELGMLLESKKEKEGVF